MYTNNSIHFLGRKNRLRHILMIKFSQDNINVFLFYMIWQIYDNNRDPASYEEFLA